ncbi:MAG: TetR/AcrR family transcriptional regulator [Solirubrobacteraceae bacterium]
MAEIVRPYRGVSAPQRRAERRERLIEAALDLIGENGVDALTMTAVCGRSRLTERYFYESFAGRDALLAAVFDSCLRSVNDAMYEALAASRADLLERCRAAAGAMAGVLLDDPRKARLHTEAGASAVLRARSASAVAAHAELLAEQMRTLRGLDQPRHEAPLRLGTLVLMSGLATAVTGVLRGSLPIDRATLIEECARLAVAVADAVEATTG